MGQQDCRAAAGAAPSARHARDCHAGGLHLGVSGQRARGAGQRAQGSRRQAGGLSTQPLHPPFALCGKHSHCTADTCWVRLGVGARGGAKQRCGSSGVSRCGPLYPAAPAPAAASATSGTDLSRPCGRRGPRGTLAPPPLHRGVPTGRPTPTLAPTASPCTSPPLHASARCTRDEAAACSQGTMPKVIVVLIGINDWLLTKPRSVLEVRPGHLPVRACTCRRAWAGEECTRERRHGYPHCPDLISHGCVAPPCGRRQPRRSSWPTASRGTWRTSLRRCTTTPAADPRSWSWGCFRAGRYRPCDGRTTGRACEQEKWGPFACYPLSRVREGAREGCLSGRPPG